MSFREITGSIASITGDPTPGARFLVIPNDFVFSSGADTMVLADAKTVIADGSGNVSFTLHEGTYQIVYQTSRGAQSRGLTVDSEGPWTLGRLVGMPSQFTPALATQIFAAAAAAEAAGDEAQAQAGIATTQATEAKQARDQAVAIAAEEGVVLTAGDQTIAGVKTFTEQITGTAVTQSATDTTTGRLMKVGDFGLGSVADVPDTSLDDAPVSRFAAYNSTDVVEAFGLNFNSAAIVAGTRKSGNLGFDLTVIGNSGTSASTVRAFLRRYRDEWSAPAEIYHTGNLEITQSDTDTTSGRLLKVGDHGLGITGNLPNGLGLREHQHPVGWYRANNDTPNRDDAPYGDVFYTYRVENIGSGTRRFTIFRSGEPSYFREVSSSGQTPWLKKYDSGSIVGTVSQSGGDPTGAIIQRGSNSNGEFVRYADGTQICRTTIDAGNSAANGDGTFPSPYRSDDFTWSFPASFFVVAPVVTGAVRGGDSGVSRTHVFSFRFVSNTQIGQARVVRIGSSDVGMSAIAHIMAHGRWF